MYAVFITDKLVWTSIDVPMLSWMRLDLPRFGLNWFLVVPGDLFRWVLPFTAVVVAVGHEFRLKALRIIFFGVWFANLALDLLRIAWYILSFAFCGSFALCADYGSWLTPILFQSGDLMIGLLCATFVSLVFDLCYVFLAFNPESSSEEDKNR